MDHGSFIHSDGEDGVDKAIQRRRFVAFREKRVGIAVFPAPVIGPLRLHPGDGKTGGIEPAVVKRGMDAVRSEADDPADVQRIAAEGVIRRLDHGITVSFDLEDDKHKDGASMTFNFDDPSKDATIPAWVKAAMEVAKDMN